MIIRPYKKSDREEILKRVKRSFIGSEFYHTCIERALEKLRLLLLRQWWNKNQWFCGETYISAGEKRKFYYFKGNFGKNH